jgi:ATP-dependent Clp protease ATP-binding subunit ClpB
MDINRFTEKLQDAIRAAQSKATRYGHQQLDVEHLFATLLEQAGGLAGSILSRAGVNVDTLRPRLEQELDRLPKVTGPSGAPDQIFVTARLNKLLTAAEDEAKKLKDEYISVEHVLLALTDDSGPSGRLLREFGASRERLMQALRGCAAASASLRRIPRPLTKPSNATAATSPSWPPRASSTP